MEPVTLAGKVFIWALFVAIEEVLENATDTIWTGASGLLKGSFLRWAGKDKAGQRQTAFARAAEIARSNTLRYAADPQQAEKVLDVLDSNLDRRPAKDLAQEAARLMLFSATPDVPRLTGICNRTLRFEALFADETPPPPETVTTVLSDFLANLREAMLDQEPYHDLIQREMLRALREVVTELRPVAYDDEATYRTQLAAMYRELEFVGIPELKERQPITVEDIFIRLRAEREVETEVLPYALMERALWEQNPFYAGGSASDASHWLRGLEAQQETRMASGLIVKERVSITEALQEGKRMVVLGDPGAGKTTLLKYLTVICAEGRGETELGLEADGAGSPLPLFVPLRDFAAECAGRDQDYCLLDYLYTHAREHLMLNLPRGFFENALEAGRCLVCLDGLDEVWALGQRKAVRDEVKALASRFPRSRYVVTSRIVGYDEAPLDRRNFTHHTILPLGDEDIREFMRKWYAVRERDPVQREQRANDLIATIEREPRIKSLAENPLLLTIIALVHRIEAELPHERVKLYDKCVTALVDTWEEVKGLTIEEKQRPFYRYRRRLLERLAYELHIGAEEPGQLRMVKEGDLELLLTRFLMENRRLGLADDSDGTRDEARAFIRLARGRTGLLVERGEGVFGFPHLTFQEYLAACDIENRCIHRGVDAIWEEIEDRLHDPHWREVILLLLGSLNKYDEPPTLLVERILAAGEGDKLEPVLHRHLYLAARVLADRVDVADDLHRRIVGDLLMIAREAPGRGREDAFTALSWLGQDHYAADGLLALARDQQVEDWVRCEAASTLGQVGCAEEAGEILLALAHDPGVEPRQRGEAAEVLGHLGRTEEAGEILLALARDQQVEDWVRCDAASTLGQIGRTEEATKILLALVHDQQMQNWVRCNAAEALGQLGCIEEARDILLALAREPGAYYMHRDVVEALGRLSGREEEAMDTLLALARDHKIQDEARSAAAEVLGRWGHAEEACSILLELAYDPNVYVEVRIEAAEALGRMGHGEEAVDVLLAVAGHLEDARMQIETAEALARVGRVEEAEDILRVLVRDPQLEVLERSAAVSALRRVGRAKESADILLQLASDPQANEWDRYEATMVLGERGPCEEEIVDGLLALYDSEVKDLVRLAAYSSLKRLVGGAAN